MARHIIYDIKVVLARNVRIVTSSFARITNIGRPSMTVARARSLKRRDLNKELTENCIAIITQIIIIIKHIAVFADKSMECNRFRLLTLSSLWSRGRRVTGYTANNLGGSKTLLLRRRRTAVQLSLFYIIYTLYR